MTTEVIKEVRCDTVGDLLDQLAALAKDEALCEVMDAAIEGPLEVFTGFKITRRTLSDKTTVLDFELFED